MKYGFCFRLLTLDADILENYTKKNTCLLLGKVVLSKVLQNLSLFECLGQCKPKFRLHYDTKLHKWM